MTDAAERLRRARINAGFANATDAAKRIGKNYQTYVAHENGSRGYGVRAAKVYASAFKVTPEWLLYGDSADSTSDVPVRVEHEEEAPPGTQLVPVYDVRASAGHGALVEEESIVHSLAFPPDYLRRLTTSPPRNLAIIQAKGESMERTLLDGDIVMLDASKRNLSYDGLFVLRFDDALHVKRVGRSARKGHIMVISDNRELYPPLEMPTDEIEPIGKVLWYGRKV